VSDWSVNKWLRQELPKHTSVLSRMGEMLERQLEIDINEHGTASRDWCRLFARYQSALMAVVGEEREKVKMQIMANRSGQQPLSDEEYANGMRELAVDALRELSTEDLAKEFLRRGHSLPVGDDVS